MLRALMDAHQDQSFKLKLSKPIRDIPKYNFDPDILTLKAIITSVCQYYDYTWLVVKSYRAKHATHARHMIFYIAVMIYGIHPKKLGKSVGKHYTTIISAVLKIKHRLEREAALAGDLRDIRGML